MRTKNFATSYLIIAVLSIYGLTACLGGKGVGEEALEAPTGIIATPGDSQVTVSWNPVIGATSYTVYRASVSRVTSANYSTLANGGQHLGVSSPYVVTGLTNGTTYYFVVAAVNAAGERVGSTEVSATPKDPFICEPIVSDRVIYSVDTGLSDGYDIGLNTSDGLTNWLQDLGGYMRMDYPDFQSWGALFITVGVPRDPPRPSQDFSSFTTLSVDLKGVKGTERVGIGIKDNLDPDDGSEAKWIVLNISPEWKTYTFDVSDFYTADLSSLYVVIEFVFEDPLSKTVFFRNIKFVSENGCTEKPTNPKLISNLSFTDDSLSACITSLGLTYTQELKNLSCSGYGISTLFGIENFENLTRLNLGNNSISGLSPLFSLTGLRELSLSENGLIKIPEELEKMGSLEALDLDGNQLTILPKEIGSLSNLVYLVASYNKLSSIPEEIGKLDKLKFLILVDNRLTTIPQEIGNLDNLEILYLFENQLTTLPKEVGDLEHLKALYLNKNKLTTVPDEIGNLSNLLELDLSDNQISSIPKGIGNLSTLIHLNLFNNQLTSIPKEIGNLGNLENLILVNNELNVIPNEIGNLNNLRFLDLRWNTLTAIPKEMGNLSNLRILYIDNDISILPSSLQNLSNLELLNDRRRIEGESLKEFFERNFYGIEWVDK